MPYEFYKIIHLIGISSLVVSLGMGIAYFMATGAANRGLKIWTFALHGLGLAFILVSGFGMLARLGLVSGMPGWAMAKLGVWALLALFISVVKRAPKMFPATPLIVIALVGTAAYLAIAKPF